MSPSKFITPEALLAELGWPANALDQKGSLSWSAALGEPPDRVMSASVICRPDAIVCRVHASPLEEPPRPHLEVQWDLAGHAPPKLRFVSQAGQPADADEATALGWFQDTVNAMNRRPVFQAMGQRVRIVQPSPPRPKVA